MQYSKAILVVSFGTSVNETREKTIDRIEADIKNAFPEYAVYRAWTSGRIIRKLRQRDGVHIDTVTEAMERMLADGVTEVIVQPTHVIGGIENDRMTEDALAFQDRFMSIRFGRPLLSGEEDSDRVIRAVMEEYKELPSADALVLMGHGTPHQVNEVYAALDGRFKAMGYANVFLGTVEASPSLDTLLSSVRAYKAGRVTLAPFMVVAGDHALNDMSGDDGESWKSRFEAEGFTVRCVLRGLGEYESIRRLYVKHIQDAVG